MARRRRGRSCGRSRTLVLVIGMARVAPILVRLLVLVGVGTFHVSDGDHLK